VTPNINKSLLSETPSTIAAAALLAETSAARINYIHDWLNSNPEELTVKEVFKELSNKDKGAAKLLREYLNVIKRGKNQELLGHEWSVKAEMLLTLEKLNIADALAWQRDAAKAGAPLSKEPLASLKVRLAEKVKIIEDLEYQVQVQREAGLLLSQRIDILSTKPWEEAEISKISLKADILTWESQADLLISNDSWPSIDPKFPPMLEGARAHLFLVWNGFESALAQTLSAIADPSVSLPSVPVWAESVRTLRGDRVHPAIGQAKIKIDPEKKAKANAETKSATQKLEKELALGHGKASSGAASGLRLVLKEHGQAVDHKLELQAQSALAAAGELEGWQKWRADQIREELVIKAKSLLIRPEGQTLGGKKIQENLRQLREEWKQTDQGGVPNHALWKNFDEACNQAYKIVETWIEKIKVESNTHKLQRLALIKELELWSTNNPVALDDDWKGFNRLLHEFSDRWRDAGHVGEKEFTELQIIWKNALKVASVPLEAIQATSLLKRQEMIRSSQELSSAENLQISAIKALQLAWQSEAISIPINRKQEQKLWDAFRYPIDEAFNRKKAESEKEIIALGEHDRLVLDASKELEVANKSEDSLKIKTAMQFLEVALRGQAIAKSVISEEAVLPPPVVQLNSDDISPVQSEDVPPVLNEIGDVNSVDTIERPNSQQDVKVIKPVIAMRGDDRPGMKKSEPVLPDKHRKPSKFNVAEGQKFGSDRFTASTKLGNRQDSDYKILPRLGDTAFRAQRNALEQAQQMLRKLNEQAHGDSINKVLDAWKNRDEQEIPSAKDLGPRVNSAQRLSWTKALSLSPKGTSDNHLIRLELATEIPTPARFLDSRRAFQLQLLTQRNAPGPKETWVEDIKGVLTSLYDEEAGLRFQKVLIRLLKEF